MGFSIRTGLTLGVHSVKLGSHPLLVIELGKATRILTIKEILLSDYRKVPLDLCKLGTHQMYLYSFCFRVMREKIMDPLDLIEACKSFVTNHIVDVLSLLALSCPIHYRMTSIKLLAGKSFSYSPLISLSQVFIP